MAERLAPERLEQIRARVMPDSSGLARLAMQLLGHIDALEAELAKAREVVEWAKSHEVGHYGEPDGLENCARNGYRGVLTDAELIDEDGAAVLAQPCTCGADDANAPLRAILARLGVD